MKFFTLEQSEALFEATKDLDIMMRPRSKKTHFASQKSDITIIEDLYRASDIDNG